MAIPKEWEAPSDNWLPEKKVRERVSAYKEPSTNHNDCFCYDYDINVKSNSYKKKH